MVYLDNAATSFPKPPAVLRSLMECAKKYCGNPGRSSHSLSVKSCEMIYAAREAISRLLGIENEENVVFTMNATYALNLAIKTSVKEGMHVIISDIEHNSVLRPLHALKKSLGIEVSSFNSDAADLESEIEAHIKVNTAYIISSLMSNVTGKEIPLSLLSRVARKHRIKLITDASQLIGHKDIDLKNHPCDILCAPGHKGLFGIQGVGFAVFLDGEMRDSFIEGGSGNNSVSEGMPQLLPERFEAGTLPTPSIVSLERGVRYVREYGLSAAEEHARYMSELVQERILSVRGARLLSTHKNGVTPFNLIDFPSSEISAELDKCGICTRSGLHCAPSAHRKLGTVEQGAVRISTSIMNTKRDIDKFYVALKNISAALI